MSWFRGRKKGKGFPIAIAFTLCWEGGYVNDPADPGGETNHGISKKAHPDLDIKNLTVEEAKEIYRKEYWLGAGCDRLPIAESIALFDTAVNIGVSRALKIAAIADNWQDIILLRTKYYIVLAKRRKPLRKFFRGWMNRVDALEELCREQKG